MSNEKGLQAFNGENDIVVRENIPMIADDSIVAIAEQAEKRLSAINKIMSVAIKITTQNDWILIGGIPYLQESGATKIARLFGISWRTNEPRKEIRADGHYTYTYKGEFSLSGATIEAEGCRSSYDEFFTGKADAKKSPDEIDIRDVKIAAYTNCINNGIKRILPGLRNVTYETLEAAGLKPSEFKGYGFKGTSKNATTKSEGSGLTCEKCGKEISSKIASYSKGKYGAELCMDCQKEG